jgi:hypothetical protein
MFHLGLLYHVSPWLALSCFTLACFIMFYLGLLYHVLPWLALSCFTLACFIMFYLGLLYHALSWLALSCFTLACFSISCFESNRVGVLCPILFFSVLFCSVLFCFVKGRVERFQMSCHALPCLASSTALTLL